MDKADIRHILLSQCHEPFVFSDMITSWPASDWSPQSLAAEMAAQTLRFRIGKRQHQGVQWETECHYEEATLTDFQEWLTETCSADNPLSGYKRDLYWCYADYKYMSKVFADRPDMLKAVDWSVFGFIGRHGEDSTWWLGSEGAYTVCHYDTYGCNLVAQIHGRKRWTLFPPEDSPCLYPTRLPYEESSVFSRVDVSDPDLQRCPLFSAARPYAVTLTPGQVLYVPRHWWHHVECVDTSISINTWIDMESDGDMRLHEAVTRLLACSLMSSKSQADESQCHTPSDDSKAVGSGGFSPSVDLEADGFTPSVSYEAVPVSVHTPAEGVSDSESESGGFDPSSRISPSHSSNSIKDFIPSAKERRDSSTWLNPTEELTSYSQNMDYIKLAAQMLHNLPENNHNATKNSTEETKKDNHNVRSKSDTAGTVKRLKLDSEARKEPIFSEDFDKQHVMRLHPSCVNKSSPSCSSQTPFSITDREIINEILQPDVISLICDKIKTKCKIK